MRIIAAILGVVLTASCLPLASPRSSPTTDAARTGTPIPSATASPTATPEPTRLMGSALVPTLLPKGEFASLALTLDLPSAIGQPAESRVWLAEPFVSDSSYVSRAATALGMSGPGVIGAAPGGGPAWRLWWADDGALAVNTASGEILFFARSRDDGPHPPGPAQADPAGALESLLRVLGSNAAFTSQPGYLTAFRGEEATASLVDIVGGTWTAPGTRDAAILFPRYVDPLQQELTIYDTDEVGLFTTRMRPVGIVHRPLGRLLGGEIYAITTFGDAVKELRTAPQRFLRFLSIAPAGPLNLTVNPAEVVLGHAWAQTSGSDLRRAGRTLVPVWVFPAAGRTASGALVTALFTVDAVVPEMRAPPASGALNIDADFLLRQQVTQLGGHRASLRDPKQVAQEFLGAICGAVELAAVDADRYAGTATCNGRPTSFTVSRAFPGLPESIWYVSEPRR
jgi:hypothetical protein